MSVKNWYLLFDTEGNVANREVYESWYVWYYEYINDYEKEIQPSVMNTQHMHKQCYAIVYLHKL